MISSVISRIRFTGLGLLLTTCWPATLLAIPPVVASTPSSPETHLISSKEPGWPQFRGPRRDGVSDEQGLLQSWPESGPILLRAITGLGRGYSSPTIVGDRLFITGDFDAEVHLLAFDLTGKPLWRATNGLAWMRPYPGARSTITYSSGRLYHQNARGRLACFDATSGSELWSLNTLEQFGGQNITWGLSECLVVDDRAVYVTAGGREALLVALDKINGTILWQSEPLLDSQGKRAVETASYVSPVLVQFGNHRLLIGCSVRHLFCADADTGTIHWTRRRPTTHAVIAMQPVLVGDGIFMTAPHGEPGRLYRLLPPTVTKGRVGVQTVWETPLDTAHGGVVHVNGSLYGAFYPGRKGWAAVDATSGEIIYEMPEFVKGSVLHADQRLYALCEDGWMLLLNPTETQFDVQGQFRLVESRDRDAWAHPVINQGILYLRYHDTLYCYDVRANRP
jgi:outer membrane protein assembly factor BamB